MPAQKGYPKELTSQQWPETLNPRTGGEPRVAMAVVNVEECHERKVWLEAYLQAMRIASEPHHPFYEEHPYIADHANSALKAYRTTFPTK